MQHRGFRVLIGLALTGGVALAATDIDVSATVVRNGVKRLGVNLGGVTYWDAGQYRKEITFRNPGFEGELLQSVARVETGGAASFVDDNPWSAWPSGYWDGATFEVVWGAARGRAGNVTAFTAHGASTGAIYQLSGSGPTLQQADIVVVRKTRSGSAEEGWWPDTSGGGTLSTELADLPPGTAGSQALRMTAGGGQSVQLNAYFDSSNGRSFMQMSGDYELRFKAKAIGAAASVNLLVRRLGGSTFLNQQQSVATTWSDFSFPFSAAENGSAVGTMQLALWIDGLATVLIDDVDLREVNTDPSNTTSFRDGMVTALTALRPGLLRYWDGQLGDSLDNQLALVFGRKRNAYSAYATAATDVQSGLHEFLELCAKVGAEPWYSMPTTFSDAEMLNLMEYLGGPSTTVYGAIRAARGQLTPWTQVFSTIHLELGNEAWNSIFKGGTIEYPDAYGGRGNDIFAAAKASPYYQPSSFNLVLGGQAVYIGRNLAIHAASTNHDSMAMAPYLQGQVDDFGSSEALFGPLFAEPEMVDQVDYMRQNFDGIQTSGNPVPLSIYEVNLHTTNGSISQAALDSFTPSLGAGMAVVHHMLMMMRDLGCQNQMIFSLPQWSFRRSDNKIVKLWGIVVDLGMTDRRRPQYLAAALVNGAIAGDMVATTHTGDDPTWNQPLSNGVSYPNAHYVHSYAFVSGGQHGLVVFNLHRTSGLDVTFSGPNAPAGPVTVATLDAPNLTDNNEDSTSVSVTTQMDPNFDPLTPHTLPAHSMTVYTWGTGGSGEDIVSGEGLGPSNGNRVRLHTPSGSATAVDFQAYGAGAWGTNVSTGNVMGAAEPQIVTGPGPGAVYGPHVRAFFRDGSPVAKVTFYAYGTLRYGVNVAPADIDADAFAEVASGAGPGAVFGPHLRAFDIDGSSVTAISKVNAFTFSTLKYGVNVGTSNVDGDGFPEFLAGSGPGAIFGSQIRAFDYDGAALTNIAKINFAPFPYTHGANVAGGDVDGDGYGEIGAAPGPGPGYPGRFAGFDYDGGPVGPLSGFDIVGFTTNFGGRVGLADTDGDGSAELLGGAGRDPAADSTVRVWSYDGAALTPTGVSFQPFPGSTYGVNVAGGPLGY